MKVKERVFRIEDIDCEITVEVVNKQKDIFEWLDDFIENSQYDWFSDPDSSFSIVYKDGTTDYIDEGYDGHKIRRNNIASMVYNNPCTAIIYGAFEITGYGVVTASETTIIADYNIKEV